MLRDTPVKAGMDDIWVWIDARNSMLGLPLSIRDCQESKCGLFMEGDLVPESPPQGSILCLDGGARSYLTMIV